MSPPLPGARKQPSRPWPTPRLKRADILRWGSGGRSDGSAEVLAPGRGRIGGRLPTRLWRIGLEEAQGRGGHQEAGPTLRIPQWSHFVPAYDTWFDDEFTKQWGEEHEVGRRRRPHPVQPADPAGRHRSGGPERADLFEFVSTADVRGRRHRSPRDRRRGRVEGRQDGPSCQAERLQRQDRGSTSPSPTTLGRQFVHYRADLWDRLQPGCSPDALGRRLAGPEACSRRPVNPLGHRHGTTTTRLRAGP